MIRAMFWFATFFVTLISCQQHELQMRLFSWIRSNGGYVNEKLEFSTGPDPTWTVRGIFASAEIAKEEVLFKIPDDLDLCHKDRCQLINILRDELVKNDTSFYWPYLAVMEDHSIDIPAVWNVIERAFLLGLDLGEWTQHVKWFENNCGRDMSDHVHTRAILLVIARARGDNEGSCMTPLYDSFNHANGVRHNTRMEGVENGNEGGTHYSQMVATQDIKQNQQIFNSFGDADVARLFRDYGFITQYPHIWVFTGDDDQEYSVAIDIIQNEEDEEVFAYDTNPRSKDYQQDVMQVYHQIISYRDRILDVEKDIIDQYHDKYLLPDNVKLVANNDRLLVAMNIRRECLHDLSLVLSEIESSYNLEVEEL